MMIDQSNHRAKKRTRCPVNQTQKLTVTSNDQQMSLHFDQARVAHRWAGPEPMTSGDLHAVLARFVKGPAIEGKFVIADLLVGSDRVAIPAHGKAGLLATVLTPMIQNLVEVGVQRENIFVLCELNQADELKSLLNQPDIHIEEHAPEREDARAYLAGTRSGNRVYLNKEILDSDIVLPLIVAEPRGKGASRGYIQGLWPSFSDRETIRKIEDRWGSEKNAIRREIQEVPWLAGLHQAMAAVPATNCIAALMMEQPGILQKKVHHAVQACWNLNLDETDRHDAAVLTANGNDHEIDLEQFTAMLRSAFRLRQCKRVALAYQLKPEALERLRKVFEEQDKESDETAWKALRLMKRIGGLFTVYSLGNIDESILTECDWVELEEPRELENLVNRSGHWLLIEDANRVRVR